MTINYLQFVDEILGTDTPEGYLCFGLVGDDRDPKRAINDHHFYMWPADRAKAQAFCERHDDEDVYVIPALFDEQQAVKENVIYRPIVSVDADDALPTLYALAPSVIVETSPARWQLYWSIKDDGTPVTMDWIERMCMFVTYSQREAGSDIGGWATNKFLRLPGTYNNKPKLQLPWKVQVAYTGATYTVAEMEQAFPVSLMVDIAPIAGTDTLPDELPDRVDVLMKLPASPGLERMLNHPPMDHKWSETLWRLELDLLRSGMTPVETYVLCLGCACDKWSRDNKDPSRNLWKEIQRANGMVVKEQVTGIRASDTDSLAPAIIRNPDDVGPVERPEFLTEDEQKLQFTPNFIDHYVEWAKTKTDADPIYHRASAIMLLATILGDFGHAVPQFGKLNLNIWMMILGKTTDSRKTTARNLMLKYIRELSNEEYEYDLGSDATTEGLLIDLASRPHRSGVHYRDEAQTMLGNSRGGKSYLSDFTETLTELYDGWVRGRRRATGAVKKTASTPTTFSLYLMGVPGKITEVLNPDDFESGFLARFVYVLGQAQPRTRASMRLNQQSEDQQKNDAGQKVLMNYLTTMRERWASVCEPGETQPILVEDDAWERFNDYIVDISNLADASDKPELMKPSADRMNKTVLKLACIIAMSHNRDRVSLEDMLIAIQHSEEWYQHLTRMTRMIEASEWSTAIRKLVEYVVERDGVVKYQLAYKKFSHLKPREFEDLVNAARDTGDLIFVSNKESKDRWLQINENRGQA